MNKPDLSLKAIIFMSMGFMGIQMGFGLQNANASRILSGLGADVHALSWFWLVAPLTGLIVQPIIGHLGDHTWTKLGRRKPYFLLGAILAALGLIFLPNSSIIAGESLKQTEFLYISGVLWLAIIFLALMDASFNISMEPFRALVGDMLPKHQGTLGFAVQTILIGIGAVLGSVLPYVLHQYLGFSNAASNGSVPENVVFSFYIGAFILLATILFTIFTTKEYSPEDFLKFNPEIEKLKSSRKFSQIFIDFIHMPKRMIALASVQFFSWFALFGMWVYMTPAVAQHHFGWNGLSDHDENFQKAGDWVGVMFGEYNFFAIPFAFLLIGLAKITSRKFVHFIALLSGGIGLMSVYFISQPQNLWISMLGVGFAWASILAMPYAMLIDSLPQHKMGVYMGIFNFFIVIPQIVNGVVGGFIVRDVFSNRAIDYIMLSGFLLILAAILTLRIREPLFIKKSLKD